MKTARVVKTERFGADTRWLELVAEEPLGFVGGQFVTVDTGLVRPNGKPIGPPMNEYAPMWSQLTDADAMAIAKFLATVPPVRNHVPASNFKPLPMPSK